MKPEETSLVESAYVSVTAKGRPSGTATTTIVTWHSIVSYDKGTRKENLVSQMQKKNAPTAIVKILMAPSTALLTLVFPALN